MFLQQRWNFFRPPQFAGSGTDSPLLGTTQKWTIDRTWPIEEILIHVNFTIGTQLTLNTPAQALTPDMYDNILTLLQHINLTVNDGKQPRTVVDCSGAALLEYALRTGLNVDMGTAEIMALAQLATFPAGNYTIVYRIPMVETWIGEPLRSRMYLPVHTYPQDPVLTLTYQTGANIYTAGHITVISTDIQLIRRQVTAASEAQLQKNPGTNPNGYIDFDLIETAFAVPLGTSSEARFALPIPGQYANLLFRHYLGGAATTRKEIDSGGTFGSENRWRLESGSVVIRDWIWKHVRVLNEMNGVRFPVLTLAGAQPLIGDMSKDGVAANGSFPSGIGYPYASSVMLNFLIADLCGDNATELGSLLDCNTPANNGLKMEVIGTPASAATTASYLYVMGRRYFGDLSKWQVFA